MKSIIRVNAIAIVIGGIAAAQVAPTKSVPAAAMQTHQVFLAGGETTSIPLTIDAPARGSVILDILLSQPGLVVGLQTPLGVNISSTTAAANGFAWGSYQAPFAPVEQTEPGFQPGNHELIRFPSTFQGGIYTLNLTATGLSSVTEVRVVITSESTTRLASLPTKTRYWNDEQPVLVAAMSAAGMPVAGMSVSATYWSRTSAPNVQLTNFQLQQETQYSGYKEQTYSFSVANTGGAATGIRFALASSPAGIQVRTSEIWVDRSPASSTNASIRKLIVSVPDGQTFSPASLTWTVDAAGAETTAPFVDVGPVEAGSAGDGVYALVLPALSAATYMARIQATGVVGGQNVVRHAWAEFEVRTLMARLPAVALTESTVVNAGGKIQTLRVGVTVNVATSANYSVSVTLKSGTGRTVKQYLTSILNPGVQQVLVPFPADELVYLGTNGPWQIIEVRLEQAGANTILPISAKTGLGSTAAYALQDLDRGDFYFSGPLSATGVDVASTGKFDIFRVSLPVVTPGGDCDWSAKLDAAASGTVLDIASGSGLLPAGSATITVDFNGNLIAQSNLDAPYRLREITMLCGSRETSFPEMPTVSGFTANQFRNIPKSMSIQPAAPSLAVPRGGSASVEIALAGLGGLKQVANLGVASLPTNVAAVVTPFPDVSMGDSRTLTVSATASALLGTYPIQVNATGPIASASAPITIQVVPGSDFALTAPSAGVSIAPGGQATVPLTITPAVTSAGTVTFSVAGLPAGATSGFTPGSITGSGTTTLTLSIAANTAPGSYPITVTGNNGEVVKNLPLTLVVDPLAMPFPWAVQHVGVGGAGATVSHSNGVFTLAGPGNSLNGASDAYHSAAQTVTGDAVFLARISRLQNAGKAGLMMRESAALGAPGVFFGWTSANTLTLQSRAAFNSAWVTQTTAPQTVPAWLRLQRTGNSFSASTSNDGLRWTAMGTPLSVTVASSAAAALTAVSETSGLAVSADFDHAIVSPGFYLSDPWPLTKTTNQQATFAFTAPALGGFTGSVVPSVSGLPVGATGQFAASSFAAGSGTTLTVTNTSAAAGTYPLTITATSGNLTQRTYATLVISATVPAIPDPWSAQTIGTATAGSGVTFASGVHTVAGGGTGFDGTSDAFQFDATALAGDGDVSARLVSITNPVTNGRAGVMIRDEGTANSTFAFAGALKTASGYQVEFVTRGTAGAAVTVESGPVATLPVWTRVTRAGNTFTAAWSADGISWTAFGTARTIIGSVQTAQNSTFLPSRKNLTTKRLQVESTPAKLISAILGRSGLSTDFISKEFS